MTTDLRRFPAHLRAHVAVIVVLLLAATGAAAVRARDEPARRVVLGDVAPRVAAAAADGAGDSRPLSDPQALDARLAAAGYDVPRDADVYAARIREGRDGPAYDAYEAGGGPLVEGFWPASSIKVLAALGALDFARSLGFSGATTVTFDDGAVSSTLTSVYEAAIRDSSNYDYDLLLMIAGIDRLNRDFLNPDHGFPATVITRSYAGTDVANPPGMTFEEGGRSTHVPPRHATYPQDPPECPVGNCSDLFELSESVRRVVLDDELPPDERFNLAPADMLAMKAALLAAAGFFSPVASDVFGPRVRVYDKPGDTADGECLDVAVIDAGRGGRYLLAASVPHDEGGCEALAALATGVLRLLSA